MTRIVPGTPCRRCHNPMASRYHHIDGLRTHHGRGLCDSCWHLCRQNGTVDDYPRLTVPSVDIVEDYEFLAAQGYTRRQAAERMGIQQKRLEKAIERSRQRKIEAA